MRGQDLKVAGMPEERPPSLVVSNAQEGIGQL
jgi:hypothetical protein